MAAASGVSGAGASPKLELLFAEVTENFRAYGVGNSHRHLHEMRATLDGLGADCDLVFTPHLLPIDRGILSTMTVPLVARCPTRSRRFARCTRASRSSSSRRHCPRYAMWRTATSCALRAMPGGMRRPTLLVFSAIDNLVKGAAGQALQNANLMLGLDETAGLPR